MNLTEILKRIDGFLMKDASRIEKDPKIIIDPGHGGDDWGLKTNGTPNRGYMGILEKDINLEISVRLAWLCAQHGIPYLLTRWGDRLVSLKERCTRANRTKAKLFISLHCNYSLSSKIRGLETWYCKGSLMGKGWAGICQESLMRLDYTLNRDIKETDKFYVLKNTKMPAILIEFGFLSNKEDALWLREETNQVLAATRILEGVRQVL